MSRACTSPQDEEEEERFSGHLILLFWLEPQQKINIDATLGRDCTKKFTEFEFLPPHTVWSLATVETYTILVKVFLYEIQKENCFSERV